MDREESVTAQTESKRCYIRDVIISCYKFLPRIHEPEFMYSVLHKFMYLCITLKYCMFIDTIFECIRLIKEKWEMSH